MRDVEAGPTAVSQISDKDGLATYRGIAVKELIAADCSFEHVAYLILYGRRPTGPQLKDFANKLVARRHLSGDVQYVLETLVRQTRATTGRRAHPMDLLAIAIYLLQFEHQASKARTERYLTEDAIDIIAKLPTVLGFVYSQQYGSGATITHSIQPHAQFLLASLGNFHSNATVRRMFEIAMILYADHGLAASTLTVRTVAGTNSDMYSAISAGVGTLKGYLHGGSCQRVMELVFSDAEFPNRLHEHLAQPSPTVPGFGHPVFKTCDPRADHLQKLLEEHAAELTADVPKGRDYISRMRTARRIVREWFHDRQSSRGKTRSRRELHPNLEFPCAALFGTIGIPAEYFPAVFAAARCVGWCAHYIEHVKQGTLIRPSMWYEPSPTIVVPDRSESASGSTTRPRPSP